MTEPGTDRADYTLPLLPGLPDNDGGDAVGAAQTAYINTEGRAYRQLVERGPLIGLETRGVSAWFGTHKVLERVSLTMGAGEANALIGPSGCGKSTFLRILNRMHEMVRGAQLAGEVLLGGEDIYHRSQRAKDVRRRIGMVFQKPNPFPAMSVYDNVASGLKLAGIKVRSKDEVVEYSLRRAGLWEEMRRRLRTPGGALSGGQQQRLCIARSLAVSPDVLLMDADYVHGRFGWPETSAARTASKATTSPKMTRRLPSTARNHSPQTRRHFWRSRVTVKPSATSSR